MKGYRFDDMQNERWIFRSKPYLEGEAAVDDLSVEWD
jgi:hypothetical protein